LPLICLSQIARNKDKVTSGDVFVLDAGLTIYQYNGEDCQAMEKYAVGIVVKCAVGIVVKCAVGIVVKYAMGIVVKCAVGIVLKYAVGIVM